MTDELAALIRELHSTGQYGLAILVVALIAVIGAGVWIIILQRQSITQLGQLSQASDKRVEEVEALIQAADSLRTESREAQVIDQKLLKDQLDTVLKVNQGFREDLKRINQKQDDLRKNVKETLDVGLQELREKLYEVSVKEIVSEIPASFRQELESELTVTSERIFQNMMAKLRKSPEELVDVDAVRDIVERASGELLHRWERVFDEWRYHFRELRHIPPEDWERYARHHGLPFPMGFQYDDRALDFLAERIAYHLRRHRW